MHAAVGDDCRGMPGDVVRRGLCFTEHTVLSCAAAAKVLKIEGADKEEEKKEGLSVRQTQRAGSCLNTQPGAKGSLQVQAELKPALRYI